MLQNITTMTFCLVVVCSSDQTAGQTPPTQQEAEDALNRVLAALSDAKRQACIASLNAAKQDRLNAINNLHDTHADNAWQYCIVSGLAGLIPTNFGTAAAITADCGTLVTLFPNYTSDYDTAANLNETVMDLVNKIDKDWLVDLDVASTPVEAFAVDCGIHYMINKIRNAIVARMGETPAVEASNRAIIEAEQAALPAVIAADPEIEAEIEAATASVEAAAPEVIQQESRDIAEREVAEHAAESPFSYVPMIGQVLGAGAGSAIMYGSVVLINNKFRDQYTTFVSTFYEDLIHDIQNGSTS